ncbi:unnamed protein product [Thlaspi arvense]|uniref:tRNA-intron lyase n=1 Tax=Thlaspi arvense TaxID=13288 RepID=A0AAU9SFU0_THLAR|nr:unnamed protein product [Thlaspi arvense]
MSDEDEKLKIHIHYGGVMSKEGNKLRYKDRSLAPDMLVDPDFLTFSIFEDFSKNKEVVCDVEKAWYRLPTEDMSMARLIWQDKDRELMKMASEAKECGEVYIYLGHSVSQQSVENSASLMTNVDENEAIEECLDDGENADDEYGGEEEDREEEESDAENREGESSEEREEEVGHEEEREPSETRQEEEVPSETRQEEEVPSEDENQILDEGGADDPRFANLFALAEVETPTVHSKASKGNVDDEAGHDSDIEGERLLPPGEYPDSPEDTDPGSSDPYPPRKRKATTKKSQLFTPNQSQLSQPFIAHAAASSTAHAAASSTAPASSTAAASSTEPQPKRRGRPPGRGNARKVTVPRGIGVHISMAPRWKWKGAEAKALAEPISKTVSDLQSSLARTKASGFLSSCNVLLSVEPEQAELLDRCCFGRPVVCAEKDKRWIQLTFEEAFFLFYRLKCIKISFEVRFLENKVELWRFIRASKPNFATSYKAYSHLRSKNWIVRSGLQYGVDFVAYRHHPSLVHSEYAVLVQSVDENDRLKVCSDIHCSVRLTGSVAKTLLVLNINGERTTQWKSKYYVDGVPNLAVEMTRVRFRHPSFTGRFIVIDPLDIPISRISNHVEDNENDKHDDVDHRHFSPALLQAPENTGFTRAALSGFVGPIVPPPCIQYVSLPYENPQSVGGLQHPDCNLATITYHDPH